jgi:broad specificity phosphatase PhoE
MMIAGKVKQTSSAAHTLLELILLCHAATRAMKTGRFPTGDESAKYESRDALARLGVSRTTRVIASPARVARDTARWIADAFEIMPAFNDLDYGRWRGHSIRAIGEQEPEHVAAWLADVHARPHGGESIAMLAGRVAGGIERIERLLWCERCIVVTHAIVVKTAIVTVLGEPLASVMKMDLAPLSATVLNKPTREDTWIMGPNEPIEPTQSAS